MRFLVVESETPHERQQRRASAGKSAAETFAATLGQMVPGCETAIIEPADPSAAPITASRIAAFDAVFLGGSPMHVYEDAPEVRRQIEFMREVFRSGVPSFGSCAGLQIAAAAAGGRVRPIAGDREAGIARRIMSTAEGRDHPLLAGRPAVWDAATIHTDEVEVLPEGASCLAWNTTTKVQAAEIRHERGVFWGVQYHPELAPGEIAAALRRSADSLQEAGLARNPDDVEAQAALFDRLQHMPDDLAARWRLGLDAEYAEERLRRREIANFLASIGTLTNTE